MAKVESGTKRAHSVGKQLAKQMSVDVVAVNDDPQYHTPTLQWTSMGGANKIEVFICEISKQIPKR